MQAQLDEIAKLTADATTQPQETLIPGVMMIGGLVPDSQLAAVYEPMIGFVVQGGKTISLGKQTIRLRAPSYFVIPTDSPATGQVHQGENGRPYLSVALRLNSEPLIQLLKEVPEDQRTEKGPRRFSPCPATSEFIDAWVRMLRLLKTPRDIPVLAPVYEREIIYRVLSGPQGWRLREICRSNGKAAKIRQAIGLIRGKFAQSIDIKRLAEKSGLATTTFHRQFKEVTGLSPVQFQKQLRLLEARQLLVLTDRSVAETAFQVGYESASQFNREYSRFFGKSPGRDVGELRG